MDVVDLLSQHTRDTGQIFLPQALDQIYHLTQGQPWLVNALAKELTEKLAKDRSLLITHTDVEKAKEILILRQDTHLDSLAERLREERVRNIIEPILAGSDMPNVPADDVRFMQDLGLCRLSAGGSLTIANPIYKEVIPRMLAYGIQISIADQVVARPNWANHEGRLIPEQLLRRLSLVLETAWCSLAGSVSVSRNSPASGADGIFASGCQRGGSIDREYAIGSGRMDLCVRYKKTMLAMELKTWKLGQQDPIAKGLVQLDAYLSGVELSFGWLVIFDQRPSKTPLYDRVSVETALTKHQRTITVVRA